MAPQIAAAKIIKALGVNPSWGYVQLSGDNFVGFRTSPNEAMLAANRDALEYFCRNANPRIEVPSNSSKASMMSLIVDGKKELDGGFEFPSMKSFPQDTDESHTQIMWNFANQWCEIDSIFYQNLKKRSEEAFYNGLRMAIKWKLQHGSCDDMPRSDHAKNKMYRGFDLGNWVRIQLKKLNGDAGKDHNYCDWEQHQFLLDQIGFVMDKNEFGFMKKVEGLLSYKAVYGDFAVPKSWKDQELRHFVSHYRHKINLSGVLSETVASRTAKLKEIGFPLKLTDEEREMQDNEAQGVWRDGFLGRMKAYKEKNDGNCNVAFPLQFIDAEKTIRRPEEERQLYRDLLKVKTEYMNEDPQVTEGDEFYDTLLELGVEFFPTKRKKFTGVEAAVLADLVAKGVGLASWDVQLTYEEKYRPDATITFKVSFAEGGVVRCIIYIEVNEHCHDHYPIVGENRRLNYCVLKAKEDNRESINFIMINVGTNKDIVPDQQKAIIEIINKIQNHAKKGVWLFTVDIPNEHHHLRAYYQRLKPTNIDTIMKEVDDYCDNKQTMLPIFDGIRALKTNGV